MNGRGQASLPALAIALMVLTGAAVVGLTLASGALTATERPAEERRIAVALSERLIAPDSPLADRENVLNQTRLDRFDEGELRGAFPVGSGADVRVRIGETDHVVTDDHVRGTTVRRLVLVANRTRRSVQPAPGRADVVALPRRVGAVRLTLDPAPTTRVETVRANGQVLLHDPGGLRGTFEPSLPRRESAKLAIEANRSLSPGSLELEFRTERTRKATLAVTVDA